MRKITIALLFLCPISLLAQNGSNNVDVKPIEIGDRFRELVVPDTNDVKVKLSDFCGKGYYTLLEFGGSWFSHCKWDVPILKGVYDKYHPYGLNLISVFFENKRDSWKKYIVRNAINWIHLSDLTGYHSNSKAVEVYGIESIPFYLIVDPQGKVIYKRIGPLHLGNTLVPQLQVLYGF